MSQLLNKLKELGTVNGFVGMEARIKGKMFQFDGTTLGLTNAAIKAGAKAGTRIESELGTHVLEDNPHETRVPEKLWAMRVFSK
jgi:hypothetical protein